MIDVTPNVPEVVAEVRDLFERYEKAPIDKNVEVLDGTFWESPHADCDDERREESDAGFQAS